MRLSDDRRPYAASCGILDEITTGNTHSTLEIIDVTSTNVLFGIFNHNMLIFISVTPKLQLQFLRNPRSSDERQNGLVIGPWSLKNDYF